MKRRLVIPLVLALVIAGQMHGAAQEPRMDEPIWSVGDTWTYAMEVTGAAATRMTVTVVGVSASTYRVRFELRKGSFTESEVPHGRIAVGVGSGDATFLWPLRVGQKWSTTPLGVATVASAVDAYETVTVPAGEFGAFRLTMRTCPRQQKVCVTHRLWIAPQAKAVVKAEFGHEPMWGTLSGVTMVLVSYAVAPAH